MWHELQIASHVLLANKETLARRSECNKIPFIDLMTKNSRAMTIFALSRAYQSKQFHRSKKQHKAGPMMEEKMKTTLARKCVCPVKVLRTEINLSECTALLR